MRESKRSANGFRLLAAIAVVGTLAAWIFLFRLYEENFGTALSGTQATWGAFGQYIGGLLTPVVGMFVLVGVLYIAHLQRDAVAEARRTQTLALLVGVEAAGWDRTSIEVDGRQQIGNALHDIDAKERSVRSNPRLGGCPFEGGADALDGEG